MKLKQRASDFRVRELLSEGYLSERGEYRIYRVTKRKLTTNEAVLVLSGAIGVDSGDVGIAGLKDRQGITTQYMSVRRGREVRIQEAELKIDTAGFADRELTSEEAVGNAFELNLRAMGNGEMTRLRAALPILREHGLVNYFDDQRFGNLRHGQGWIARDLMLGRTEDALRALLCAPSDHDDERHGRFKALLRESWGDWRACREVAGRFGAHHSIFEHLRREPEDFAGAFYHVASRLRLIHLYAFQSHLWNRAVAGRVRDLVPLGERVVMDGLDGPLVGYSGAAPAELGESFRLPGEGLEDVDVPEQRKRFEELLREQGLAPEAFRIDGVSGFRLKGEERPLVLRPRHLRVRPPEPDPESRGLSMLRVRFELPRGAYATLVVKRLVGSTVAEVEGRRARGTGDRDADDRRDGRGERGRRYGDRRGAGRGGYGSQGGSRPGRSRSGSWGGGRRGSWAGSGRSEERTAAHGRRDEGEGRRDDRQRSHAGGPHGPGRDHGHGRGRDEDRPFRGGERRGQQVGDGRGGRRGGRGWDGGGRPGRGGGAGRDAQRDDRIRPYARRDDDGRGRTERGSDERRHGGGGFRERRGDGDQGHGRRRSGGYGGGYGRGRQQGRPGGHGQSGGQWRNRESAHGGGGPRGEGQDRRGGYGRDGGRGGYGGGGSRPGGGYRGGGSRHGGGSRDGGSRQDGGYRGGGSRQDGGYRGGGSRQDGGYRAGGSRQGGGYRGGGSRPGGGSGGGGARQGSRYGGGGSRQGGGSGGGGFGRAGGDQGGARSGGSRGGGGGWGGGRDGARSGGRRPAHGGGARRSGWQGGGKGGQGGGRWQRQRGDRAHGPDARGEREEP